MSHVSGKCDGQAVVPRRYCSARLGENLWQNRHNRLMKLNLPNLLIGITIFAVALIVMEWRAKTQVTRTPASSASVPEVTNTTQSRIEKAPLEAGDFSQEGQNLVKQSVIELQALSSLEVKLKYRTFVYGEEISGTGQYWQLGEGPEKLLRMDLKIASASGDIFQQEICTHQHFWTRKMLPLEKKALLERVDLLRLRTAVARVSQKNPEAGVRAWQMLGGITRIVSQLDQSYLFGVPREMKVKGGSLWRIRGRLHPSWIGFMSNRSEQVTHEMGEQIPLECEIYLAKESSGPKLFPYMIDYYRYIPPPKKNRVNTGIPETPIGTMVSSKGEPLALLMQQEFLLPQSPVELDARFFDFDPGDAEYDDQTQACLIRLELSK